jgi:hypothetical protein
MNEQPLQSKEHLFKILVVVSLVLLAGAVAWLIYRVENLPENKTVTSTEKSDSATSDDQYDTGWNTTVSSGKGAFKITFPDGWGPLIKDKGADSFIMSGAKQPNLVKGAEVKIIEVEGSGSDNLSLFSAVLLPTGSFAPPQGEASEFTIGKGEGALVGKKYTHIYPKDDLVGIGYLRLQGDRDYEYAFKVGDKELRIFYGVYGSDPRNQIDAVDEIVRTITLPN